MTFKKGEKSRYTCSECGELHSNWPALAYSSPDSYNGLTEEEKKLMAEISSDFCIINHENQTDRFIRVSLTQLVLNAEEDLDYGLWVSLSEKSYNDYKANFNNENHEVEYFGWLCNEIPDYESTFSIPMTVVTQKGNQRPKIFPHRNHDHNFVRDFYNGISSHEAQERVDRMIKA